MTKQEAIEELRKIQGTGDVEGYHIRADEILCELLSSLGLQDVVDEYNSVEKWYA